MFERWIGRTWLVGLAAAGLLVSCTSSTLSNPAETTPIETAPPRTVEPTPATTATTATAAPVETTTLATVLVTTPETSQADAGTTPTSVTRATVAAQAGAPVTVYSTPEAMNAPGTDTYPTPTGDYTDQDFARIAAGRYREYWTQAATLKPNLKRLKVWETDRLAKEHFDQLTSAAESRRQFPRGSIDDFVVTQVDRASASLVLINVCVRNNTSQVDLGKSDKTVDDKVSGGTVAVSAGQWALSKNNSQWKIDAFLQLEAKTCDAFLG
jgi:hypothetical protein